MPLDDIFAPLNKDAKEIRVLHLDALSSPNNVGEQYLTGRLAHISLTNKPPPYFALSYVWGNVEPVSAVMLDNGSRIPIAQNLLIALQHIKRHEFLPVSLSPMAKIITNFLPCIMSVSKPSTGWNANLD